MIDSLLSDDESGEPESFRGPEVPTEESEDTGPSHDPGKHSKREVTSHEGSLKRSKNPSDTPSVPNLDFPVLDRRKPKLDRRKPPKRRQAESSPTQPNTPALLPEMDCLACFGTPGQTAKKQGRGRVDSG